MYRLCIGAVWLGKMKIISRTNIDAGSVQASEQVFPAKEKVESI